MVWDKKRQRAYNKTYYLRNKEACRDASRKRYASLKDDEVFREGEKYRREFWRYGSTREAILSRYDGRCTDCTKPAQVIHHLDGDGKGDRRKGILPGRNPDRLIPLCRSCHMKRHWQELFAARLSDEHNCGKGRRRKRQEPGV